MQQLTPVIPDSNSEELKNALLSANHGLLSLAREVGGDSHLAILATMQNLISAFNPELSVPLAGLSAATTLVESYLKTTAALHDELHGKGVQKGSQIADDTQKIRENLKKLFDAAKFKIGNLKISEASSASPSATTKSLSELVIESSSVTTLDAFIKHLTNAKETLKSLSSDDDQFWDSSILALIAKLIDNWGKAIGKIKQQTNNTSRQAIAQSIQIHDLLEEDYSYLADVFRTNDLLSPAIL